MTTTTTTETDDSVGLVQVVCPGLPVPRCLLAPREECHGDAFELTTSTHEEEPPGLLELTAEDGDEDVVDEKENNVDGETDNDIHHDHGSGGEGSPEEKEEKPKPADGGSIPDEVLSRIVAVDCGMAQGNELRRVSVVDGRGGTLLSALVRVDCPRAAYHSAAAGYVSSLLPRGSRVNACGDDLDLGVPAELVREEASKLLRGKIVVGHSVGGDLAVLGFDREAWEERREFEVRDTASYPPFQRETKRGERMKYRKLSDLVDERLGRDIQPVGKFHCCEEDAIAALDLYKLVWHEWEASLKAQTTVPSQVQALNFSDPSNNDKNPSTDANDESKNAEEVPLNIPTDDPQDQKIETKNQKWRKKKKNKASYQTTPAKKKSGRKNQNISQKSVAILTNKKKKGKKKSSSTKTTHEEASTASTWFINLDAAVPTCNHACSICTTVFLHYPILVPLRMTHDIMHLAREISISIIRTVYHRCMGKEKSSIAVPKFTPRKDRKKKRKSCYRMFKQKYRWFKNKYIRRRYFENIFLLCHILLEVYCILSLMIRFGTSADERWNVPSMHRANGSLAAGLVGMHLLRRKHQRNDRTSQVLFQILAQYRLVSLMLSMINIGHGDIAMSNDVDNTHLSGNKIAWLEILVDTISQASLTAAAI